MILWPGILWAVSQRMLGAPVEHCYSSVKTVSPLKPQNGPLVGTDDGHHQKQVIFCFLQLSGGPAFISFISQFFLSVPLKRRAEYAIRLWAELRLLFYRPLRLLHHRSYLYWIASWQLEETAVSMNSLLPWSLEQHWAGSLETTILFQVQMVSS